MRLCGWSIRRHTWPGTRHVLRRGLAAGVTVVGLACGVGAIAASQMLYGAVLSAYETTIRGFAGRAALQVTNGDSGVAEELADELRRVPGVQAVLASAEGWVATPDLPIPFSPPLEDVTVPTEQTVFEAARDLCGR